MSKFSSFKKQQKLFEGWRGYVKRRSLLTERVTISPEEAKQFGALLQQAYDGGPAAVRAFMNTDIGESPKFRKFIRVTGAKQLDGAPGDDVVSIKKGSVKVGDMIPTQRFIDLNQSVGFPLGSADTLLKDVVSKKGFGPITVSGNYIIDGHHRWSGIFSAGGPDATISVMDLAFKGDAADKLASAQIAVAAVDKRFNDPHPSKGGAAAANILGKGADQIYQILNKYEGQQLDANAPGAILNKQMLQAIATNKKYQPILDWAGVEGDDGAISPEDIADAIKRKVADNLAALPMYVSGAPERPDMPQMDHAGIGGKKGLDKIMTTIPKGDINLAPPFNDPRAQEK